MRRKLSCSQMRAASVSGSLSKRFIVRIDDEFGGKRSRKLMHAIRGDEGLELVYRWARNCVTGGGMRTCQSVSMMWL